MQTKSVPIPKSKLRHFLEDEQNVVFATVFGSAKDGLIKAGSDLDLAVYFASPPQDSLQEFDFYSRLCDAIPEVDTLDLTVLNSAGPVLAFEALKGTCIVKKNPAKAAGFYSATCRLYEDRMAWYATQHFYRSQPR